MKVFVLKGTCGGERKVSLGADSAVLRPGEPVFLPESGNAARLAVIPAVRIGRLGYCVRSNFASYVDAATLFMYLQPDDSDTPSWLPPFIADRSFSPGKWTALPPDGNLRAQVQLSPLPGRTGSTEVLEFATSLPALDVRSKPATCSCLPTAAPSSELPNSTLLSKQPLTTKRCWTSGSNNHLLYFPSSYTLLNYHSCLISS